MVCPEEVEMGTYVPDDVDEYPGYGPRECHRPWELYVLGPVDFLEGDRYVLRGRFATRGQLEAVLGGPGGRPRNYSIGYKNTWGDTSRTGELGKQIDTVVEEESTRQYRIGGWHVGFPRGVTPKPQVRFGAR